MPTIGSQGEDVTGEYTFEDNNLDMFAIYDYRQTTLYHGANIPDQSYYQVLFVYFKLIETI